MANTQVLKVFTIRASDHRSDCIDLNFNAEVESKLDLLPIIAGLREYGYEEVNFEYVEDRRYTLSE